MDIRKVKKLIELLDESGIAVIELTEGEESVRISRYAQGAPAAAAASRATPPATIASRRSIASGSLGTLIQGISVIAFH